MRTLTIEQICKSLSIETPEAWDERHVDACECQVEGEDYWDVSIQDYRVAERDYTCDFHQLDYWDAVETFYRKLLSNFHLDIVKDERSGAYELVPEKDWNCTAKEVIEVINGVGLFYFGSLEEAIESSSCADASEFVKGHVGWIPSWFAVYEGGNARSHFERYLSRR